MANWQDVGKPASSWEPLPDKDSGVSSLPASPVDGTEVTTGNDLDIDATLGELGPPTSGWTEVWVREETSRDNSLRRQLATVMFGLFAAFIFLIPLSFFAIAWLEAQTQNTAFAQTILTAIEEFYPVALSAITGVFGTVIGFYFGSEQKK